jgi:peptidoglycan/xylan/chitin deacetylase (PgdA/CDA1 family)
LRRKIVLSLTFDDGTADHVAVARLLAERGIEATFYLNSNRVGSKPSYLDWPQVDEIAAAGHEIGAHTADHVDLSQVSTIDANAQVVTDRRLLRARGFEPYSFAYPYGALTEEARSLVLEAGYSSARRAWGLAGDRDRSRPPTESVPPLDAHAIKTVPSIESATTLEQLQRIVVRGERNGGWLPLVFHGISSAGGRYDLPENIFRSFVDWLRERNASLSVRTVHGVVDGG